MQDIDLKKKKIKPAAPHETSTAQARVAHTDQMSLSAAEDSDNEGKAYSAPAYDMLQTGNPEVDQELMVEAESNKEKMDVDDS